MCAFCIRRTDVHVTPLVKSNQAYHLALMNRRDSSNADRIALKPFTGRNFDLLKTRCQEPAGDQLTCQKAWSSARLRMI